MTRNAREEKNAKQPTRRMGAGERIWRYVVMFAGIFFISVGVALLTKSDLGTSAISVIPYTASLVLPQLSYGTYVALFNGLLVVLEALLLRRDCDWFDIVQQMVLCLFFGSFVDLAMWLLSFYHPQVYALRFATLLVGVVALAFGAYLTLISRVGVMAGDGFTRALSKVSGREFGIMRVCSDSSMMIIAVVLNLALFGGLVSVREGTVVSALCTGFVVGFFNHHLGALERVLLPKNAEDDAAAAHAAKTAVPQGNFIVTVSRQYGSGGREIGHAIADGLGIAYFDSNLIARMAAETGLPASVVEAHDQRIKSNALEWFNEGYAGMLQTGEDASLATRLFEAETKVVRQVAAEGDCVIVGRLANHILLDHENTLDLFILSPLQDRIEHAAARDGLTTEEARAKIEKVDHERAEHCRHFTHAEWGDARNYDFCVNTSKYGIGETGAILTELARTARDRAKSASQ